MNCRLFFPGLRDINEGIVKVFVNQLIEQLQNVISSSVKKSFSYNKETMWKQFYLLRTSEGFIKQWTDFLANNGKPVQPVLYQHLTDRIFGALIVTTLRYNIYNRMSQTLPQAMRGMLSDTLQVMFVVIYVNS